MNRKTNFRVVVYALVLLFILAVGLQVLHAQSVSVRLSDQQYVSTKYDNTKGLPVNTIFRVIKDEIGFLWAVTEEGLVRFDGINFRIFNQENVPEIVSPYFYDLTESSSGGIWAANVNAIVHAYRNQIDVYEVKDYVQGSWITSISEDDQGNVWAGTQNGNLIVLMDGEVRWADGWSREGKGSVMTLKRVSDGLLIGTQTGLHKYYFDSDNIEEIPEFSGFEIRAAIESSTGNIWAGTRNNGILYQLQDTLNVLDQSNGLVNNQVNVLQITQDGSILAGMGSGGVQLISRQEIVTFREVEFGYNEVNDIYISDSGIVWLSATGHGIIQMIPADIRMLREEDGLSNDITLAIYQDHNGVIWTGTPGAGVNRIENGEITHITPEAAGMAHGVVLGIYGVDDYIYFGTGNGLYRYNPLLNEIDRTFTTDDGLASNIVQAIYQDSLGNVWVTSRSGGIHRLRNHVELERIAVPDPFKNAEFTTILEDSRGNVWFTTTSVGILKIDRNNNATGFSMYDGQSSERVMSLYEDPEGSIWAGTNEGLLVLKEDQFKLLNRNHGLQFNGVFRMIEDNYGYLWASGNFGIQRMKVTELLALKNDESGKKRVHTRLFDTSDGMANPETNGGVFPAGWQMDNGEIWFPTVQGIAKINPSLFIQTEREIDVHILTMRFGESEFSVHNNISIPPGVHNLEIHYVSFDYKKPHTINYSYRVNELSDEWQSVGNRSVAYFTLLNPGSYTFEVKAEQFGVESEIASVSFDIEPFFHQTRLFIALVLAGLFMAGYFVHLFYSKSQLGKKLKKEVDEKTRELQERNQTLEVLLKDLERSNEELEQFAFITSHDLQEPLRMISSFMDKLKLKYADQLDDKALQYIHFATDGAKRMKQIILDLLLYSRANKASEQLEEVDLNEIVSDYTQLRRELIAEKNATITFDELPVLETNKAPITQIIHCLLDNSLRYVKENVPPRIEIHAKEKETVWEFAIKDNGIGIDQMFHDKIFIIFQRLHNRKQDDGTGIGLSIAKRSVEFVGGEIWLESTVGEGSTFYFTIAKNK
ncbi:two-component regulator propeller domain-containing protein [Algoriphagus sp. C2-6-M1]|uniref:two-component regulator propeller domain-containing protein n=1 Tax=Algoriphagus persicinus TaxID=3108754 RepID=UPI002B3E2FFE|nr:two-component regulator propeller domain-containing protein [Algoriphagus sp. C2-6-M1]MEB2780969.1 two-component regulator propeller domain-containing protein [Algoriphagus sp. C2-6-M1]